MALVPGSVIHLEPGESRPVQSVCLDEHRESPDFDASYQHTIAVRGGGPGTTVSGSFGTLPLSQTLLGPTPSLSISGSFGYSSLTITNNSAGPVTIRVGAGTVLGTEEEAGDRLLADALPQAPVTRDQLRLAQRRIWLVHAIRDWIEESGRQPPSTTAGLLDWAHNAFGHLDDERIRDDLQAIRSIKSAGERAAPATMLSLSQTYNALTKITTYRVHGAEPRPLWQGTNIAGLKSYLSGQVANRSKPFVHLQVRGESDDAMKLGRSLAVSAEMDGGLRVILDPDNLWNHEAGLQRRDDDTEVSDDEESRSYSTMIYVGTAQRPTWLKVGPLARGQAPVVAQAVSEALPSGTVVDLTVPEFEDTVFALLARSYTKGSLKTLRNAWTHEALSWILSRR